MKRFTKTNPYLSQVNDFLIDSPLPANINYFYGIGSILGLNLVVLIITGITLAKHYNPSVDLAFISSEHIIRDVFNGWLIRYTHANAVSMFFILVYIHIARGLYYGSYRAPRATLWIVGVVIYICMMATAFIGFISLKWLKNLRNLSSNNHPNDQNPLNNAVKIYDDLHLITTQILIRDENRHKAAVYMIYNKINNNYYIGSAITNRINTRFRNHMFHGTGNSNTKKAVNKYGLENFKFVILEYYPGIILKENLKKGHILLLERENYWINLQNPIYNILKYAIPGPNNYKHNEETREKKKANYSEARKEFIRNLNLNKSPSYDILKKMQESAILRYKRDPSLLERMAKLNSKPVTLLDLNNNIIQNFKGVRALAKYLKCCHKTVNKAIHNNTILKNIYRVKYTKDLDC